MADVHTNISKQSPGLVIRLKEIQVTIEHSRGYLKPTIRQVLSVQRCLPAPIESILNP